MTYAGNQFTPGSIWYSPKIPSHAGNTYVFLEKRESAVSGIADLYMFLCTTNDGCSEVREIGSHLRLYLAPLES